MPLPVSDRGANKNELIDHAAELLSRSAHRRAVFTAIYRGKKKTKSVQDLMSSTGLIRNRVLDAGRQLASNDVVGKRKSGRTTLYEKIDFFQEHRNRILRLASNRVAREKLPTKRRPQGGQRPSTPIKLDIRAPARSIKARHITVDDIDSFSRVRRVTRLPPFVKMPEREFKQGVATILGERGTFKDWGGELSDLTSTRLTISGTRRIASIAFKGPGTSGKLTPAKMGKNGDQIQRLLRCPAEVFLIQYWAEIDQAVIEQLQKLPPRPVRRR